MKRWMGLIWCVLAPLLSASCVVAGRSSRGGWFVWPGGLTLLVLLVILFLLLRRR